MTRIDGDDLVANKFQAVSDAIDDALRALMEGRDRLAASEVTRARLLLTSAMTSLEQLTDVPYRAIPIKPDIGK